MPQKNGAYHNIRLITLEVVFHLSQVLVGLLDLGTEPRLPSLYLLSHFLIGKGNHFSSEDGSVLSRIHTNSSYRNARRHLDDAKHGIKTIEHPLDRHADYWQRSRCCDNTRKGGSHTGSGDDNLHATLLGSLGE